MDIPRSESLDYQSNVDNTDGPETFLLGNIQFSLKDNQLRNEQGEHLPLRSQAGAVLACLIKDNGHIVSKGKLHKSVWGEAIVTETVLCNVSVKSEKY